MQAKQNLQLQNEERIILLADKGYQPGTELQKCQEDHMITHVAYKEQSSVKHIVTPFLSENFKDCRWILKTRNVSAARTTSTY